MRPIRTFGIRLAVALFSAALLLLTVGPASADPGDGGFRASPRTVQSVDPGDGGFR